MRIFNAEDAERIQELALIPQIFAEEVLVKVDQWHKGTRIFTAEHAERIQELALIPQIFAEEALVKADHKAQRYEDFLPQRARSL